VAYSPDLGYAQVDSEVAELCQRGANRLTEAGAEVEQIDLDWADPYDCWNVFFYGGATARLRDSFVEQGHLLDPGLRAAVEEGMKLSVAEFTNALTARNEFWLKVCRVYDTYDLLVTPTLAVPPFRIGQNNADPFPGRQLGDLQWTAFTYPINLTGQPATSVPCGWTASNLPVGMQIIGRRFDDGLVLRAARAWEQIQPWADRRPSCNVN